VDGLGRTVNYLRLSITDRCNLRCAYCHSPNPAYIPHPDILRYEELVPLVGLARSLGIRKVRLTGGEPLVRRDFTGFIRSLRKTYPDLDLRLTTNATLLAGKVRELADLGLSCINISLDTLNREKYQRITGRDFFPAVRRAMDEVLEAGMRLKVNAVAMRGVNDDELPAFLDLARNNALDMRFIEYMPMGAGTRWSEDKLWPSEDILTQARKLAQLAPVNGKSTQSGPARLFAIQDGKGRVGVISPLTSHFCGRCNRLRITPEGRLRTCLFSDREYRLMPLLRHPDLGLPAVSKVLKLALARKPVGAALLAARTQGRGVAERRMSAIGG
jgi:cyclic pyranopterin phosphate synthase